MGWRIERRAASPCVVAEGPRWCAADRTLYWVDLTGGRYLRQRDGAAVTAFESVDPGLGKIGALAPLGGGRLRLFTARCEVWDVPRFGDAPVLRWKLPGHETRRFNDAWIDGANAFCGVAHEPAQGQKGELWLLRDGAFSCLEPATDGNPNGLGVSPDGRTLYFVVSDERRIYAYDYDRATGRLANRRVLCDDFAAPGVPDGMTVDPRDGTLWVAIWDGARLEHRARDGRLVESIPFPMKKVTSVEVGEGRVFVTTGNKEPDAAAYFAATGAGSVFELKQTDGKSENQEQTW